MKEIVIIGAGPAGMTAAIYASDAGLSVKLIERGMYGGQMTTTALIDNYPGSPGIPGWELSERMYESVKSSGVSITTDNAVSIEKDGDGFIVNCQKESYKADAVIIANGVTRRKLRIPGEEELKGRGVSYCAVCDGNFFRGKEVAVVGGGNSALEDASYLAGICSKVYLIHRRDEVRADDKYLRSAKSFSNIEFIMSHIPVSIKGEERTEGIEIRDLKTGKEKTVSVSGVFIATGLDAENERFSPLVSLTEKGYIEANEDTVTSCPGIFAAGDTREKKLRQIVTACADGAVAAKQALDYVNRLK